MKGILLAGGSGTRLGPLTAAVSKQLLPVYDKPMVYHPLSTLMLAGIRDVLIVTAPDQATLFKRQLGDGSQWGIRIDYAVQPSPNGIAQAITIGSGFLDGKPGCLILGDNFFYGDGLRRLLCDAAQTTRGATIFGYEVKQPSAYAVIELDDDDQPISLEEKPSIPRGRLAVPGLYFYDGRVAEIAKTIQPSSRGELEIVDVNRRYLKEGSLRVEVLGRGMAWLDMGTPDGLLEASSFVNSIEKRTGLKIACLEQIALTQKWIDASQIRKATESLGQSEYAAYLRRLTLSI